MVLKSLIYKKVDFTERIYGANSLKISTGHCHEEAGFHKFHKLPPLTELNLRASELVSCLRLV